MSAVVSHLQQQRPGVLVTRQKLMTWGFVRLPDVWLACPSQGRHNYFERWYHAQWNYTVVVGWPGKDPLVQLEEDFLATIQAHLCDESGETDYDPWDDIYGGF